VQTEHRTHSALLVVAREVSVLEENKRKVAVMYRSPSLKKKELMALYGLEDHFVKDEDCISEVRTCFPVKTGYKIWK